MEVDWVYPAEVSVLWQAFLNRVITNFLFFTCRKFLGFLCDCQVKGRTFSIHRFACFSLQRVSVGRYIALVCRKLHNLVTIAQSEKHAS